MEGNVPKVFPELGLPQVVPAVQDFLDEYIKKPENLPIHSLDKNLRHIHPERDIDTLFNFHSRSYPLIQRVTREPSTGKLVGFQEVELSSLGETAKNSLSLNRAPGAKDEGLKGSSTNFPFWPGGFDEEKDLLQATAKVQALKVDEDEAKLFESLFEKDLQWIPPTLQEGLALQVKDKQELKHKSEVDGDVFADDRKDIDFWKIKNQEYFPSPSKAAKAEGKAKHLLNEFSDDVFNTQEDNEPKPKPVLKISKTTTAAPLFMPWAETVDVTKPMLDFSEKVPIMAKTFPFELDIFQKQAIAKLEEHENVFVAAHTSAGKTVVAEYAIALSVQHMTRTIYTSPIKALSNQKFRDFKNHFESVGLVTGDVQINPGASVLIMTTEILRSMLYNGSDVIRDLEWVVFDEIHYLNNEERGHVWEEVLIMLPPHVSIIMLSATVPNALQFANWVGEIKKKKIYVITTPKRPVPLEHYLYTGSGGKSRDEVFMLLNSEGKFMKGGFDHAKEAKLERMSKHQQQFGAKGGRNVFNENSEKTTYIGLVDFLKRNEKLPVVIFTFSRNRCDQYAQLMSSVDLCTNKEQGEIHGFFIKSISRLKGMDRELPQVKTFHEMLKHGIGVHHSGILPILKEVVEMLFQKGLVKLLFATETFAMGVNMPARTVVFDSIRKHDGTSFRTLNPAEYIQMAGRAGRRGLDTTGTVIILCKQNVPDVMDLQNMMTGKAAKLESQFRLTYSMILNLLRVESLTVEDVMKRSFLEANSRMQVDTQKEKLTKVKTRVDEIEWGGEYKFDAEFQAFYTDVKECFAMRESVIPFLKSHTRNGILVPGRIILVEHLPKYQARFGVILECLPMKVNPPNRFKVLILTSELDNQTIEEQGFKLSSILNEDVLAVEEIGQGFEYRFNQSMYYSFNGLTQFSPQLNEVGYFPHTIVEIEYGQILDIADKVIRADSETIAADIRKREQPRFSGDWPPANVCKVIDDLAAFNIRQQEVSTLPISQRVIPSREVNVVLELQKFADKTAGIKRRNLKAHPDFKEKFHEVFSFMRLKDAYETLEYLLSPRSLRLHEEYHSRLQVLRKLGYIDNDNLVQMKGRVACEMGNQNELMVTEMVLNNMFATAPPAQVAAILSCLVFEAKKVEEPKLDDEPALKKGVEEVKALARYVGKIQNECGLKEPAEQYVEQFRFGLAEVVHEWSKGKCFCDIMKLTDVQEGLIVRTIQRLDEMIRDVKDAARIIGDPSLKKQMEESSESIKRDIVFAASLYTQ